MKTNISTTTNLSGLGDFQWGYVIILAGMNCSWPIPKHMFMHTCQLWFCNICLGIISSIGGRV